MPIQIQRFCLFILVLSFCCLRVQYSFSQRQNIARNEIPIIYEGHIYIQAEVSGKPGNFILDTGADYLYLDSTIYASHTWNYNNITQALLPGAGEKPKEIDYILDSVMLEFGTEHYKTPGVPVLDLKSIVGDRADGIIGFGYFKDRILEVDYKNQVINTYKHISDLDLTGFEKIDIEVSNNRMFLPMVVSPTSDLKIEGKFLLDFGTSRNVILTSACAKEYDLSGAIPEKAKYFSSQAGVGGESSGYDFRATSVRIAGYTLAGVVLDYTLDESGALASNQYAGLLGNGVLDRFDVILDYKGKSIYLKPLTRISDSFYASATGFSIADRSSTLGFWIVTHLHESAQADLAGLKIGDHITHVDKRHVSEISYQERIEWHKTTKYIELTVRRKEDKPFQIGINLKEVIQ